MSEATRSSRSKAPEEAGRDAQDGTAPSGSDILPLDRLEVSKVEPNGDLKAIPEELRHLRKRIYGEETGYLSDDDLIGPNDAYGCHVLLYARSEEGAPPRIVGATHAVEAELCDFARHSRLPREDLRDGVYMTRTLIDPSLRNRGLYSLLMYHSLADFRVRGRSTVYAYMEPGDTPLRARMRYDFIEGAPPRVVKGREGRRYELHAVWGRLEYGLHRAWATMPEDVRAFAVGQGFLADEIEATIQARLADFYAGPWAERLFAGELTKEAYVTTLSNMHQFVRWTTRILARVVAMTPDSRLRRHYIAHLAGEIDHERWIENDLAALGADVAYVRESMVPLPSVRKFMCVQESLCSFHQDPVLFLAVPLAVEGISAKLPEGFGPALFAAARGWGVEDPRKVTSFLGSHAHTDGGDDGHWEKSRDMLRLHVTSEKKLQEFLGVIHVVMDAQCEMYSDYVSAVVPGKRGGVKGPRALPRSA